MTTHNLAVLVDGLGLRDELTARAPDLAGRALRWAVGRLTKRPPEHASRLRMIKNAAYAWRQAIFFLSLADVVSQRRVLEEFEDSPVCAASTSGRNSVPGCRSLRSPSPTSLQPVPGLGEAESRIGLAVCRTRPASFDLALAGLRRVIEGARFDAHGQMPDGRRFLGWSRGRHWISPD